MAITSIKRDWGVEPAIVRITSTDTLAAVGAADYILGQADNIKEINAGEFEWLESDLVLVYASDGWAFYTISSDFQSLEGFAFATNVAPSHVVVFADQLTTVGGAAAEAFTVTGALATDLAFVQVVNDGTAGVTVLQAVVTANTLTVTFSANPGADTIINYQLLRAAA